MQSTLIPKSTDDPHDVLVVASDVIRVAPTDEELSKLAKLAELVHDAVRPPTGPQTQTGPDLPASPPVPPVDATFRPAAVDSLLIPSPRRSLGRLAVSVLAALLLAACIGAAAVAWQSYGNEAKQMIAKWAPQFIPASLLSPEKPGLPAQPTAPPVQAAAADAASPQPASQQPAPPAQAAPEADAPAAPPSADSAQLLQSMVRDLASVGQQVEQLKASIEQLKANQQQMARDMPKAPDQNARPKVSALPPRPAGTRARRSIQPYPYPSTQAVAAPSLPPAAAPYYPPRQAEPYVPRQPEPPPQATAQPQDEQVSSVPRPPLPVR